MIKNTTKQMIVEELLTAPINDLIQGILIPLDKKETVANKTVQKIIDESGAADRPELVDQKITFNFTNDGHRGIIFSIKDR